MSDLELIGLRRRVAELETEVEGLKRDLARSLAHPLAGLEPCECVGCICVLQTSPNMMRSNTYCKMPRASIAGAGTGGG